MGTLLALERRFLRVKIRPRELVLGSAALALVCAMASLIVMSNLNPNFALAQHFTHLAQAFLHGQLYFIQLPEPHWNDIALFQGHPYWPLGPFPAILLLPFVYVFGFMGWFFYQGYLQFWLTIATIYLVFRLARLTGFGQGDSWYLSFAVFASTFFFCAWAPNSYYMAHVVVVLLWFAALVEYMTRKRYWLLGLLCGLALATRVPAGFGIAFFMLDALLDGGAAWQLRLRRAVKLASPFVVLTALLMLYNYARFGSLFEQGYSYQVNLVEGVRYAREYGLFGLIHLPGNLYYLLLAVPQPVFLEKLSHVLAFPYLRPDLWGMSIFVTSPYLLYLFAKQRWDRLARLALVVCVIIALPILFYYGVGFQQFGYRYALDFFPLLYFVFMRQYRARYGALSFRTKLLVVGSAALNLYLFGAIYSTLFD
jgi:hypothetical protein